MKLLAIVSISVFLCLGITQLHAQDKIVKNLAKEAKKSLKIKDTSSAPWRFGGIFHLNFSQSALSHWAAGGDKSSLSLTGLLNGYASYTKKRFSWKNILDIAYGYSKTSSTGYRKSDDHLYLTSQVGYAITEDKKWYYSALIDFKTQFAKGYLYDDSTKTINSAFLSPGYLLASAGISYRPTDYFNIYISPITERWTFVKNDTLSAKGDYGVTKGSHVFNELGAFLSAHFSKDFGESIHLKSRLDLFSNYKHNPQNIDINFTNLLSLNVTKYIATTISLSMIYDDDVKFPVEGDKDKKVSHLQLQEVLGIGLSYNF